MIADFTTEQAKKKSMKPRHPIRSERSPSTRTPQLEVSESRIESDLRNKKSDERSSRLDWQNPDTEGMRAEV